jgi:hypothetical protein
VATGNLGGGASSGDGGRGDGNSQGAVAAFLASPLAGHVASSVPSTITATAPVVSAQGASCQTVTQTIDIGGQAVRAAAVVCRQPDGHYQIVPMQSAAMTGSISARP